MNHPDQTKWQRYAADELPDREREQLEQHLAECESCLLIYMAALEGVQLPAGQLTADRAETVTNDVMASIAKMGSGVWQTEGRGQEREQKQKQMQKQEQEQEQKQEQEQAVPLTASQQPASGAPEAARRRLQQQPRAARKRRLLHYVIAVCFMLLMMSAGIFDRLAAGPEHWKSERSMHHRESLTDTIMERTSGVIDSLVTKPMSDDN